MNVLQFPHKNELVAELFPMIDHDISQSAMDTVEEQGNVQDDEILMITDTVQSRSCYTYATFRHTCCECGIVLPRAREENKKQGLRNVINCFKRLTTTTLVFKIGTPRGKQLVASKTFNCTRQRVSIT